MKYANLLGESRVKQVFSSMAAAILLFVSLGANAIMISVSPAGQTVTAGDSVSVDVVVSGLGAGIAPSIGAFDLDVVFDTSILTPTTVTFGTGLDVNALGTFQVVTGVGPVNVFELSFDSIADLELLQPDTFLLFSIDFDAIAAGVSGVDLLVNDVADAAGNSLASAVQVAGGQISVDRAQGMPAPATLMLLGLGLAGLGFARSRPQTV